MKGIQFNTEETQLLIEALLHASVTDICAEWTPKQVHLMIDLAKKLNTGENKLTNIYLFNQSDYFEPTTADRIKKEFPNIPVNSVISD